VIRGNPDGGADAPKASFCAGSGPKNGPKRARGAAAVVGPVSVADQRAALVEQLARLEDKDFAAVMADAYARRAKR
jgi:hypothetical protein